MNQMDTMAVSALRVLSADAVEKAKSGHPGLPLGAAPMAYELFARRMKHNPEDPTWFNRDRFILSGGHGSALLYSLLHLFGYGVTMEDMKNFRQLDSKTPGHPEYGMTPGVEASTGPLGAGMGMAVGMAMAEAHLAAIFNKEGFPVVDHYTFVLGGDGCMMEGIASEAFSLAGTLKLGKLIVLYDSNRITIEGSTDLAFTEDVQARMKAFGFQTIDVKDGNDLAAIGAAIDEAKADTGRPSFITIHTEIGYGCPAKQGKSSAHGEPLGADNIKALRETLGWPYEEAFVIPEEVYNYAKGFAGRGRSAEESWKQMFERYCQTWPVMKELWDKMFAVPAESAMQAALAPFVTRDKAEATRSTSGKYMNILKDKIPAMMGGSADLAPSNKTALKDAGDFSAQDYRGSNIHYGVRELAMAAITNGMCLHGGVRPFAATFFVFSDYIKPMVRLSALMELPVTFVLTHDSIGVGEDGPTHQPIEQLAMYRAMPGVDVWRPADAAETAAAWAAAAASVSRPTLLALSRQNLEQLENSIEDAAKGAYIVRESAKEVPDAIIIATGSEVSVALAGAKLLKKEGIDARVISMPCEEVFERQPDEYKEKLLPKAVRARVGVEAASGFGWEKYVGLDGAVVCMHSFGQSAPAGQLFERFGFTAQNVAETVKKIM
ncbi:MAG: transketolase [Lachnospiraceae bacterium]|nr:transketolase [Lachnospiraceae bacterium]